MELEMEEGLGGDEMRWWDFEEDVGGESGEGEWGAGESGENQERDFF